ncbi:MAG: hypothetical protein K0V04_07695 [Deltaproteobacteria bacterium]|nr:hypothetical protein [Deltaproteobacteria bacterium]
MDEVVVPSHPVYRTATFGITPTEIERMEVWLNERATEGYAVVDRLSQRAIGGTRQVNVLVEYREPPADVAPEGGE